MSDRKTRKSIAKEEANSKAQICMVAGYMRLSVVKKGQPYDSIETQKTIIEQFISQSDGEILLHKMYVDEKVSGTTFERRAFQEMLSDIEKGLINCVIVKDLSRLGRNFLEAGYYIEQYFPHRSIRSDIAQLKQNFHLYCTFRRAMSEKSACEEIVSINLKKATVKSDGSVDVLFF